MSEKVKIKIARNVVHLPAIALRGLVVFPNNVVHFEVGRTKSIAAIEAAPSSEPRRRCAVVRDVSARDMRGNP